MKKKRKFSINHPMKWRDISSTYKHLGLTSNGNQQRRRKEKRLWDRHHFLYSSRLRVVYRSSLYKSRFSKQHIILIKKKKEKSKYYCFIYVFYLMLKTEKTVPYYARRNNDVSIVQSYARAIQSIFTKALLTSITSD